VEIFHTTQWKQFAITISFREYRMPVTVPAEKWTKQTTLWTSSVTGWLYAPQRLVA
jgi:hypothetical protein